MEEEEENPYKKKFENWDEDVRKMYEEEERRKRELSAERKRILKNLPSGIPRETEFEKRQREHREKTAAEEANKKKAPSLKKTPEWIQMVGDRR